MTREERYRHASAEAERRKAAFLSSAQSARDRIAPARLKQDVKDRAADGLLNGSAYVAAKAQQRPIAFGAAAGALVIYLFRKPLWTLFRPMYVRISKRTPETSETENG